MLFHVTLRHKPVDCPGRNPDKARASRAHFADRDARQRELGYKMRAFVGAWPSHVEYALIEAPDLATVQRWIGTLPNEDMETITPVGRMADLIKQGSAEDSENVTSSAPSGQRRPGRKYAFSFRPSPTILPMRWWRPRLSKVSGVGSCDTRCLRMLLSLLSSEWQCCCPARRSLEAREQTRRENDR